MEQPLYGHANEQDLLAELQQRVTTQQQRQRVPKSMGDVVNRLIARRGYARVQQTDQIVEAWKQAVGEDLAEMSRPGNLRRGVLEVFAESSVVLQELTFAKPGILHSLNQVYGGAIKDLRLKTAGFR